MNFDFKSLFKKPTMDDDLKATIKPELPLSLRFQLAVSRAKSAHRILVFWSIIISLSLGYNGNHVLSCIFLIIGGLEWYAYDKNKKVFDDIKEALEGDPK